MTDANLKKSFSVLLPMTYHVLIAFINSSFENLYYFFFLLPHSAGKIHWYEQYFPAWTRSWPIKCHCHFHIETNQLICSANQLTDFYMRLTLALDGLRAVVMKIVFLLSCYLTGKIDILYYEIFPRLSYVRYVFQETSTLNGFYRPDLVSSAICDYIRAWYCHFVFGRNSTSIRVSKTKNVYIFFLYLWQGKRKIVYIFTKLN